VYTGVSGSVEGRIGERALDRVSNSLPEVLKDVAVKKKRLNDEHARLQEELKHNQVSFTRLVIGQIHFQRS